MPFNFALEADFLIALAAGSDSAECAVDLFCKAGGRPIVSPSVLQELQDMAERQEPASDRYYAKLALANLSNWGFLLAGLNDLDHQIAVINANKLVERKHCHDYQTALVFVEAASLNCMFLLTYHPEMCGKDGTDLRLFMRYDCHLTDTFVLSPLQLIQYVEEQERTRMATVQPLGLAPAGPAT